MTVPADIGNYGLHQTVGDFPRRMRYRSDRPKHLLVGDLSFFITGGNFNFGSTSYRKKSVFKIARWSWVTGLVAGSFDRFSGLRSFWRLSGYLCDNFRFQSPYFVKYRDGSIQRKLFRSCMRFSLQGASTGAKTWRPATLSSGRFGSSPLQPLRHGCGASTAALWLWLPE